MSTAWITRGFEGFSQGTCGHAGHNLYVSRQGVLQRIHQYDFNGDGFLDLVFCNSQNHWEKPPAYVYQDPLGQARRLELPADAARSGCVADLNNDGSDDLVLGMWHNGIRAEVNARIYFGSPDGFGEQFQQQLPAPMCRAAAAGDFDGDGRMDLAFLSQGRLRLFYQSSVGFEPQRFIDLEIEGDQLAATDLDQDGFADLVLRAETGDITVYWGGPSGIDLENCTPVPVAGEAPAGPDEQARYAEYVRGATPLVQVVHLQGIPHIFVARTRAAYLVPVDSQRHFGAPLKLDCPRAMALALGDLNHDGHQDLVLASRQPDPDATGERSWIYWGSEKGFDLENRTSLASQGACDVAVGDLDGDGCDDIVLCQSGTEVSFSTESLIYRGTPKGVNPEPCALACEDARRVFLARPAPGDPLQVVFANHFSRSALGDIPVSIYAGGPDGFVPERLQQVPGWGAVEAICCDIDDDGRADLVLANASENSVSRDPGSYLFLNRGGRFGDQPDLKLPTTRAHGVACADLNQDGYLDLVFCGFNNPELLIFYGAEKGFDLDNPTRIQMEYQGEVYREPRWVYLADLDNDGFLDLVVPLINADRSFVLWGGPEGFSMQRCQALSVFRGACARAADLNGNGYLDLIVGGHIPSDRGPHDTFLYIYWNGPEGLREDRRTLLPAYGINALSVADFNDDGSLDLFACSYHDGRQRDIPSYIWWNRAGRGFSETDFTRLFTHSASGCVAGDFDEDGRVDLAIAYHKIDGDHLGHSAIWWNGPDGLYEDRDIHLPTSGPHGMTAVGPGNIADRGPEEYYQSPAFELPAGHKVQQLAWQAEIPPKSWVRAQLRFAATKEGLEEAEWQGPPGARPWYENLQPVEEGASTGQWVQYRLALGARHSGSSPRVREVVVHHG